MTVELSPAERQSKQMSFSVGGRGRMINFSALHERLAAHIAVARNSIEIYAPYVTVDALNQVMKQRAPEVPVSIVTTWKLPDLLLGASTLDLYSFCVRNGFYLFLSQRLHLKTTLVDYSAILTGSANVTGKGLGLASDSNHETLVSVRGDHDYLVYLQTIRQQATLVTTDLHQAFSEAVDEHADLRIKDVFEATRSTQAALEAAMSVRDFFLISELPLTSVGDLFDVFQGAHEDDPDLLAAARHDLAKYNLGSASLETREQFYELLRQRFFAHPFIEELCAFIDRPRRFGEIKEWVQNRCTNVPVPTRRELTENIQVLYDWLKHLGEDRFRITRPRHSELISPVNWDR